MNFGSKLYMEERRDRERPEKREEIACDCWFCSTGRMIPRFLKYRDKEGMIHQIGNIEVLKAYDRRYCGIRVKEYVCRTVQDGRETGFTLYFNQEECRWKLTWRK